MIRKYQFGNPIDTGAVVLPLPCEESLPAFGKLTLSGEGFLFTLTLSEGAAVYGLGENVRGINKRGWRYVSDNSDQPHHSEEVVSLYSAHNLLLFPGKAPFGLFFDYPAKMAFDIGYTREDELAVSCERADLDLYVIEEESLTAICRSFRKLTGRSYIPPKWAFGFGQSRWGYRTAEDFRSVVDTYRSLGIPLDALYMDIDYMDNFKDFTVNPEEFPDFAAFVREMQEKKVHLVPIIDAGVKKEEGYDVCEEGLANGWFVTDKDGKPFVTACWPGLTYHPDFLQPAARRWFGHRYKGLIDQGIDGFWNDMNEPALFYTGESMEEFRQAMADILSRPSEDTPLFELTGLPEKLFNRDTYKTFYHNVDGKRVRHDEVHNLYGYQMTRAAGEAFEEICPDKRILMFSRSSYIGMHRYGGIWQGDNKSWWSHLLMNIQMSASLNMCGFLYTGADIGGFGSNATRDLLLRWLAFGVFTPLMRDHSALGTRDQECYRFERPEDFAHVVGVRYRLLPYLYSEYMKAALGDGLYFRPLAFDYPEDPMAGGVEDQLMLGEGLMVAPIYTQNAKGRCVYLPEDMLFVKFTPSGILEERMTKGVHYIEAALNEVPLFVKKEHLLPLAEPAACVGELDEEHLTLLGWTTGPAEYLLYNDDGYSKNYEDPSHFRRIARETLS